MIDSRRQRDDLRRAVEFASAANDIDSSRIALWGTSLGGSYVVDFAANGPIIAAVVAKVPGLELSRGNRVARQTRRLSTDPIADRRGRNALGSAALDAARGAVGLAPHYIAV